MTGNGTEIYLQKEIVTSHHVNFFFCGFKPFWTTVQCSHVCWQNQGQTFYFTFSLFCFRLCHDLANLFWSQSKKADNEANSPTCQLGTSHKIITSSQPTSMTNYNWHHTDNVSVHHMFSRILKLNYLFVVSVFFVKIIDFFFDNFDKFLYCHFLVYFDF
jgi:hypothetical protein